MTATVISRIAGSAFLLYIAGGITTMLFGPATGRLGTAAKLVAFSENAQPVRLSILLGFVGILCAFVLGVTLRRLTQSVDRDLAMPALCCPVAEGVLGAVPIRATLSLLELSKKPSLAGASTDLLFRVQGWTTLISATFFAVGSTIFSYLLLRGRFIPLFLSSLGVFASSILVLALPFQLTGFVSGTVTSFIWIPMLFFEVPLAIWLLAKGVSITSAIPASQTG